MLSREEYNTTIDINLSEEEFNKIMNMPLDIMNDAIDQIIIADHNGNKREFVPKKCGKWISKEYMYGDPDVGIEDMWIERLAENTDYYAYCSICNKNACYSSEGTLILSDFCPSCGAYMRGVNDE